MKTLQRIAFLTLFTFFGCTPETSRSVIELPIIAIGDARDQFTAGELEITILEAKLALGPLYFCASSLPSDHVCESARLELLDPFVIDLLSDEPDEVGLAQGSSGRIASAQYNFGRSIFAGEVLPTAAGESVDGHSGRFVLAIEGPDDRSLLVRITLDLDPARSGSLRVLGHRTEIDLDETISALEIRASAFDLLSALDYSAIEEMVADPNRDVGEVELTPSHRLYEGLASRLSSGIFPVFNWSE